MAVPSFFFVCTAENCSRRMWSILFRFCVFASSPRACLASLAEQVIALTCLYCGRFPRTRPTSALTGRTSSCSTSAVPRMLLGLCILSVHFYSLLWCRAAFQLGAEWRYSCDGTSSALFESASISVELSLDGV